VETGADTSPGWDGLSAPAGGRWKRDEQGRCNVGALPLTGPEQGRLIEKTATNDPKRGKQRGGTPATELVLVAAGSLGRRRLFEKGSS
jgi:hypothetical protein